jgi:hypothetical protein
MVRSTALLLTVLAMLLAVVALVLSACGAAARSAPAGCTRGADTVLRALAGAPGTVVLPGGSRLSACLTPAQPDGDLQNVGLSLTPAADALAERARHGDATSAFRLGYLIGALERRAAQTNGIHAELVRRVAAAATGLDAGPGDVARGLAGGLRAGRARG